MHDKQSLAVVMTIPQQLPQAYATYGIVKCTPLESTLFPTAGLPLHSMTQLGLLYRRPKIYSQAGVDRPHGWEFPVPNKLLELGKNGTLDVLSL